MNISYYTVDQIAELLHIHPKTIQRYIREGKLPASKIGKSWRVSGHDLSRFAEGARLPEGKTDTSSAARRKRRCGFPPWRTSR
jgi:excisionase family DNA binding protein